MIQAICWVLIHSLWQGVLLALVGGGVILCTKRSAAAVRYRLLCGLAGVFLCGMGATFVYEWTMAGGKGDVDGGVGVSMNWFGDWFSAHAVQVVAAWLIVTMFKSVRMAAGWGYMRRMRREGLAAPALWVERMDVLSRRLGIRRTVKLVESAVVRVPMVIGQLRPIVYIPLGLVNHLPASEMEAVLMHELAHIRRCDHLVNMVQQAAECLLFFNPGFLWISSLIQEERENCCDDIAIRHTRDRVEFVRALVRFKEHSLKGMALAFPGNKRQLLHRVLRISRQENKTLSGRERLVLLGGCLVLLCLLVARAGKADVQKAELPVMEARLAEAKPVKTPAEVISVLQAREKVAQNMEWVKTQLDQLHHKSGIKKKSRQARAVEQVEKNMVQAQASRGQDDQSRVQAERDRLQADRDRQQAEQDRIQAERDRQQAEKDRQQATLDEERAKQNKVEEELKREWAARDREKAELIRQQAERERAQADREQQERNRVQELENRVRVDRDREHAELDRQHAELVRRQAELDRQQARRDGQ
jgi:bla regulator protein BlaR1